MNYSNTPLRPGRSPAAPPPESDTVLSLETDKRGTHLRVRKVATILRRARRALPIGAALLLLSITARGQFVLNQSTGLFSPSFRNTLTLDAGNTTWFGWTGNNDGVTGAPSVDYSGFDGATLDSKVDNPAAIVGIGGLDGHLNQVGSNTMVAGSKNIFAGDFTNASYEAHLTLQIPTNGTPGVDGFTTIILQGVGSVTGGDAQVAALPGAINGISPTYVSSVNAGTPSRLQWWAKYEIPGNAAIYTVDIALAGGAGINPGSLRELVADTKFSTIGYATDSAAAVPEPTVTALLGGIALLTIGRRRR